MRCYGILQRLRLGRARLWQYRLLSGDGGDELKKELKAEVSAHIGRQINNFRDVKPITRH